MNWKKWFFVLLTINIVIVSLFFFLIFQPSQPSTLPPEKKMKGAMFTVYSSKEHVNAVINDYIRKKTKDHPLQYRVWLSDRVYVASKLPVFGRDVDLTVSFVPNVVQGGNLELRDPDMSLGELQLPVTYVLKYLQKHALLPEGVIIDPNYNRIYVALNEFRFANGYQLSAKKFDLQHNQIEFTLTVPVGNE
ncbi:YpmS family protein [Thermaerobacillus caldiproteolyticus]|uniref:YpmS family protein n=1 Tax=Thermaerobacillus caldiproteolyticus TaxID=247480 RepID=UPI00188AE0AF|nr:YpmS family protein [Anoxybacillus caldiproteolyticus]QPA32474.1 YpmS family protein [Anoxybacillus caldiproteolyticus]